MISDKFISVVVPIYNSEEHISKCIEAFEKQTFKDFNVIFVDDCSVDNSYNIILEYSLKSSFEIICHKNEKNSGPAKSRNIGINLSNAEYIAFCDSDDWYEEDYLEKMVYAAKQNNSDIVFCGHRLVFSNSKDLNHFLPVDGKIEKLTALTLNIDSLWTTVVRRSIAKNYPMFDLRNGEDMAIIPIWMLKSESFFCVSSPLYNYFVRENSLSSKTSLKVVNSLEKSFEFIMKNFDGEYKSEVEFIGIRNLIYGGLLNLFKVDYDKITANRILVDFEKNFPHWERNKYLSKLSFYKKIFVKCAKNRFFVLTWIMAKIHTLLIK